MEKKLSKDQQQLLKLFVSKAKEYGSHANETSSSALRKCLGEICASLDPSIFDPDSRLSVEFYMTMHELMSSLSSRNTLIWSVVDVLQVACENSRARNALIHTYKFSPILSKLLEANLTVEKRKKVLKLLQELTYGVKISWQESHLPFLISTLTQWVTQQTEEEVVTLSLGVLVNLCYKNLPAVYTLMRTIDIKCFLRALMKITTANINTRVQLCKLMIILKGGNKNSIKDYILDFVAVTFNSLESALEKNDVILMQHVVDFFDDVRQDEFSRSVLVTYPKYEENVEKIVNIMEEQRAQRNPSIAKCVTLVMEFLLSLINLKMDTLASLYPLCAKTAMTWVHVCPKALALIRTMIIDSRNSIVFSKVLTNLDLSSLTAILKNCCDNTPNNEAFIDNKASLTELTQLFFEMAKLPDLRLKILQTVSTEDIEKILSPLLKRDVSGSGDDWATNIFQEPTLALYVHTLALMSELALHNTNWRALFNQVIQMKQVHMLIASALYSGDVNVKNRILQMPSSTEVPPEYFSAVARRMEEIAPLVLVQGDIHNTNGYRRKFNVNVAQEQDMIPLLSLAQEEQLDTCINKFNEAFESNQIQNVTTSAVMELYEYKIAAMAHSEKVVQTNLEAANTHVTNLQHRLAQVVSESNRLHQLLLHTQQCLDVVNVEKAELQTKMHHVMDETKRINNVKIQEIENLKKIVLDKTHLLEEFNTKINEKEKQLEALINQNKQSEVKNQELSKLLQKMQDSLAKKEEMLEAKEKKIASNRDEINALQQEIEMFKEQCSRNQQSLEQTEKELAKLKAELMDMTRMRDMIIEITKKQI